MQTQIEQPAKATGKSGTSGESGFMLVYAAVMVAIVMIGTAVAIPVMAKQLRRDKEVESMHRMQQYVRAIQLYQRACKCTNYPPSMEALEKGTNVRFLRQEYVDPLTGKSDWRIIHNPQTTVKGFFGQELTGLVVRHHASTPRTPESARTARMRRMPLRMRLFTVPSGWPRSVATSR